MLRLRKQQDICSIYPTLSEVHMQKYVSLSVCVAFFEAKYEELEMLGEGGFGSVYAGRRKTDNLPVSTTLNDISLLPLPVITKILLTGL